MPAVLCGEQQRIGAGLDVLDEVIAQCGQQVRRYRHVPWPPPG